MEPAKNALEYKQKLSALFAEWKKKQEGDGKTICNDGVECFSFHADGLVDPEIYYALPKERRVLFLLKEAAAAGGNEKDEPYVSTAEGDGLDWVRRYIQGNAHGSNKGTLTKMAKLYAAYFAGDKNIPLTEALRCIGLMNISKRAGRRTGASRRVLFCYLDEYHEYLQKEIDLLAPAYILVGWKSNMITVMDKIYPGEGSFTSNDEGVWGLVRSYKCLEIVHPSGRRQIDIAKSLQALQTGC